MTEIHHTLRSRMPKLVGLLRQWDVSGWAAGLASLLAASAYGLQAWGHSSGQASVLDEGLYLYKGYLFASGRYWPFQDSGPWTNHMPLSFLIPGWVQLAFGLGLRTGRSYALVLAGLLLLAVWILGRRLGGRWWGAAAILMLAVNSFLIKIYSQAISQVLVACMLAWMLALTLGRDRPHWQLGLGGALAGAVVMTRVNLLPTLPLLLGYIFLQHGKRAGWRATIAGVAVVIIGHAVFWPGILKLWAYWLPPSTTPFLDPRRELSGAERFWNPETSFGTSAGVFFGGVRRNLFPFLGLLLALMLWPRGGPENRFERRDAGLLLVLFVCLVSVHAWAALGQNYCVFCFSPYLGFFSHTGILLLALAIGRWYALASMARRTASGLLAVGLALWAQADPPQRLASLVLATQLPRMKELRMLPGSASVEILLNNRFNLQPTILQQAFTAAIRLWSGLLVAGALVLLGSMVSRRWRQWGGRKALPWLNGLTAIWLTWLSLAHGNTFTNYDCGADVVSSYEAVGSHLQRMIPPGSSIYWAGTLSPVPLLYLPEVRIFPAQLNRDYSFRIGGDPASLLRFGFWNREIAETWLSRADFTLVEQRALTGWLAQEVRSAGFEELPRTPLAVACRTDSSIRIFRRVQ